MKTIVTTFLRAILACWFICVIWVIIAPFVFAFYPNKPDSLTVFSLVISAMLIAITVCYDNMVEYYEEKYGPLSWKSNKNTYRLGCMPPNTFIYVVGGVLFSLLLQSACTNNAHSYQNELSMYRDYYYATETLLDSLGVDCDNPILESDAGANYLEVKSIIDNY